MKTKLERIINWVITIGTALVVLLEKLPNF